MFNELLIDNIESDHSLLFPSEKYYNQIKDSLLDNDEPFSKGLMIAANRIQSKFALDPVDDISSAAIVVSASIISRSLAEANQVAIPHKLSTHEAEAGSTLACFVSSIIAMHLKEEGQQINIHRLIRETSLSVFQMYHRKDISNIVQSGIENFREMIDASKDIPKLRKVGEILSNLIWAFVKTRNEEFMGGIAEFYIILYKAYGT